MDDPKLWCDDVGVWRQDGGKKPFGIEWTEINRICGYQLGVKEDSSTVLELIFEFGTAFDVDGKWEGYHDVVDAPLERFPIEPTALESIEMHDPETDFTYIELWSRLGDP